MSMQMQQSLASSDYIRSKEIRKNFQPVVLETICVFPLFALKSKRILPVRWQQDLEERVDDYLLLVIEYVGKDPTKPPCHGRLFVSAKYLDVLESKTTKIENPHSENEWRALKIDNDFQYGQADAKGAQRFLVLHDKQQKPFQHRFVNSRWVKAGNLSLDLLDKKGFGSRTGLDLASEQSRNYFGDYLHNFDGTEVKGSIDTAEVMNLLKSGFNDLYDDMEL